MTRRFILSVFGSIFALALSTAQAASPDNPILGTWKLNVGKSKFTPGPGWKSQIRVYRAVPGGVSVTWTGVDANGATMRVSYAYKYDGLDYPMTGGCR